MKVSVDKIINSSTYRVSWSAFVKNSRYHKYQKIIFNKIVHLRENLNLKVGDCVSIAPCRPVSKIKRWEIKGKS